MKTNTIPLIGGPLDGTDVPRSDYFKEGDSEVVNTLHLMKPWNGWSAESVYVFNNGNLTYDQKATEVLNNLSKEDRKSAFRE